MALLGTLQVRMGLDTASFGQQFTGFTRDLERRAKGLSRGLSGLTNFGSLVGGAGIGAALTQGISVAGDFESSINQVAAAADLGAGSIANLSRIAIGLSKGTVFSANQAAAAMLALAKAGIAPAEQEAGALAATMQLAASEGMELSLAAETIAQSMGAFKLRAGDTASIADALAGASIASTASVEGLSLALAQVAAVAYQNGASLNDTTGALALFAQNGIKGSDAGTSLKTMFLRLIPQTDKAKAAMDAYGISFENADGSIKSLTQVADILQTKLGGLTAAQRTSTLQTIFGTDAFRAAAILTESGAAGLEKYIAATRDKNAAEKLSEARIEGARGAMLRFKNSLGSLAISLSRGGFLEGLANLADGAARFVDKLSALPQWAKTLGVGFAIAAAAVPPLALAISSIALAAPAVMTAVGAITTFLAGPWGIALAVGIGAVVLFKDQIIAVWNGIKEWFRGWVADNRANLGAFKAAWDGFVAALAPLWTAIKKGFSDITATVLAAFGTDTTRIMQWFKDSVGLSLTAIVDGATFLLGKLTELAQWITASIPGWVATFKTTFAAIVAAVQAAEARFQQFLTFMRNLPRTVTDSLKTLWTAIKAAWDAIDWASLGRAVVDGIIKGIDSRTSGAISTARTLATGIEIAAKNALGIQSPSKVFTEIGENVGDGFINGIRSKIASAGTAVKDLVTAGQGSGFGSGFLSGITQNTVGEAAAKRFFDWTKSIKDGAIQVQSAWTSAMNHVGSAIDEFVKTGKLDFSDLVRSIIADLASASLKNAFNGILQGILGITGGGSLGNAGGSGSSWLSGLGSIFGSFLGGFSSFEGGGYTGDGSRSGGLDGRGGGLAMLHPQETVVDHTRIKKSADRSRRGDVNLSVPITLMPGVSKQELAEILPLLKRDIIETIPRLIARGGRYAGAFGQ